MKLLATLEPDETGMLVAECPSIPGCISQGRTEAEALENIREAIAGCLETRAAHGMPPTIESERSRFLRRWQLHLVFTRRTASGHR
jgi:predicted RNase H-like HicB family nuclease